MCTAYCFLVDGLHEADISRIVDKVSPVVSKGPQTTCNKEDQDMSGVGVCLGRWAESVDIHFSL